MILPNPPLVTAGDINAVLHGNTPRAGLRKEIQVRYATDVDPVAAALNADIATSYVEVVGTVLLVPAVSAA